MIGEPSGWLGRLLLGAIGERPCVSVGIPARGGGGEGRAGDVGPRYLPAAKRDGTDILAREIRIPRAESRLPIFPQISSRSPDVPGTSILRHSRVVIMTITFISDF